MAGLTRTIRTHSHIDAEHAAGPYFPEATSSDGRFSWHHGHEGYVALRCEGTGLSDNTRGKTGWHQVYLQYGDRDPELSPELLAEARAFHQAVMDLKEQRRAEAWERAVLPPPERADPDAWRVWRGPQSMDDEDSIF